MTSDVKPASTVYVNLSFFQKHELTIPPSAFHGNTVFEGVIVNQKASDDDAYIIALVASLSLLVCSWTQKRLFRLFADLLCVTPLFEPFKHTSFTKSSAAQKFG